MAKGIFTENDMDRLFRMANFGIRSIHKEELRRSLFAFSEDELSEDELLAAAGGDKKPDDPVEIRKD